MKTINKRDCSLQQRQTYIMAEKTDFCENLKFLEEDRREIKIDVDETDSIKRSVSFINKYKMDHAQRGKAIVFNHFRFMTNYTERKGTESDVKNLTKALLQLGFKTEDIHIHNDLTASQISDELKKIQNEDHSNRDLLMIFVLTHGSHNDRISASDVEYPVECIWEPFRADKCRTLAGKPKIFFVNACRGEFVDQGQRVPIKEDETMDSLTEVDARPIQFYNSYSIPVWSDFLYVFSTYKGYVSYRNTGEGSWYIQAFCEELSKTNLSQVSFTDFLTAVNGRLSRLFESGTAWDPRKQIPTFNSTLTKCLYFTKQETQV